MSNLYRAVSFLHCQQCLKDMPKPGSPRDYARLQVGITRESELEIWCVRHDRLVSRFKEIPHIASCSCQACHGQAEE